MIGYSKKKLIALLLCISCIIAAWLLFLTPAPKTQSLQNFAQIDSLLHSTLTNFNISKRQLSSDATLVDSSFKRIKYRLRLSPKLSKTQLHAALNRTFSPFGIELPARVSFPNRDMRILFYYKNTILRTLTLATDDDLSISQSFGSLLAVFTDQPGTEQLQLLKSWGKPIPIAISLAPPYQQPPWWDQLTSNYQPVFIWPQTENGQNLLTIHRQQPLQALKQLKETLPRATLLSFYTNDDIATARLSAASFKIVDASKAYIFDNQMGQKAFNKAFRDYVQQARTGSVPLALLMTNEETLQWTQQQLSLYSLGGFALTEPSQQIVEQ